MNALIVAGADRYAQRAYERACDRAREVLIEILVWPSGAAQAVVDLVPAGDAAELTTQEAAALEAALRRAAKDTQRWRPPRPVGNTSFIDSGLTLRADRAAALARELEQLLAPVPERARKAVSP